MTEKINDVLKYIGGFLILLTIILIISLIWHQSFLILKIIGTNILTVILIAIITKTVDKL